MVVCNWNIYIVCCFLGLGGVLEEFFSLPQVLIASLHNWFPERTKHNDCVCSARRRHAAIEKLTLEPRFSMGWIKLDLPEPRDPTNIVNEPSSSAKFASTIAAIFVPAAGRTVAFSTITA